MPIPRDCQPVSGSPYHALVCLKMVASLSVHIVVAGLKPRLVSVQRLPLRTGGTLGEGGCKAAHGLGYVSVGGKIQC